MNKKILNNIKEISLEDFLCYKPIENCCTPYPEGKLKDTLGNVIWDKRDFNRILNRLHKKCIWTIYKGEKFYYIIPGIYLGLSAYIVGYIVTDVSYNNTEISNKAVKIAKDE